MESRVCECFENERKVFLRARARFPRVGDILCLSDSYDSSESRLPFASFLPNSSAKFIPFLAAGRPLEGISCSQNVAAPAGACRFSQSFSTAESPKKIEIFENTPFMFIL